LLLVAIRTAHPLHHIIEFGFPTSECGEGVRVALPGVATGTTQNDDVLPEMVAEFVYN
jgi:hypothetical protein